MKSGLLRVLTAAIVAAMVLHARGLHAAGQAGTDGGDAAGVSTTIVLKAAAQTNIFAFEGVTPLSALHNAGRLESAPPLFRFMIGVFIFLIIPALFKKLYLPSVVGLIIAGILCGPHVLCLVRPSAPVLATLADVGRLLLLFYAGLEVDIAVFNQAKWRAGLFGALTFLVPCCAGMALGMGFGYSVVASTLIGSLLASHTLLGYPIAQRYGLVGREAVIITVGATIFTDILSLTMLTVCVSIHMTGFDPVQTGLQMAAIGLYIVVVLFGLSKLARWFFTRYRPEQDVQMLVLLLIVTVAALLAERIHMEGIVGAFIAGLAVNRALHGTEAHKNIEVLGNTLFLPAFFLSIGLAMNLPEIMHSIMQHFWFVVLMSGGLIAAKFVAAWIAGARFHYSRYDWLNMWSLSVPQVAATLAAALVAYDAVNDAGQRLINQNVLSSVLVMVIVTAIGGPILTQIFCAKIKAQQPS